MLTNADCTLYIAHGKEYARIPAQGVHWEETKGVSINKTGSTGVNTVRVFIPFSVLPLSALPVHSCEGFVARGIVEYEPIPGQSILPLVKEYGAHTLTSVEPKDFGSPGMQHWEVFAK